MKREGRLLLYVVILWFFIIPSHPIKAEQQETDRLVELVGAHQKNDTIRANLQSEIATAFIRFDADRSFQYADSLEKVALYFQNNKEKKLAQRYLTKAWLLKGNIFLNQPENDKAASMLSQAILLSQQNGDKNEEAKQI